MSRLLQAFFLILLSLIIFRQYQTIGSTPYQETNQEILKEQWLHSQYNLQNGYEFYGNMEDNDLRALASLELLAGSDPTVVNFEDPLLAKYFFGLSNKLTKSILLPQFMMSTMIIILIFLIGRQLTLSKLASLIPSFILVNDPLFIERTQVLNLDIQQLFFLLLGLYFITIYAQKQSKRILIALGLSIGGIMSSKVIFIGILFLIFSILILMLFNTLHRHQLRSIIIVVLCTGLVYVGCYYRYFSFHLPLEFIHLHLQIVRLYRSYLPEYPWFEIWRILLFGKWNTWFSTPAIQPVEQYWFMWPMSFLVSAVLMLFRNRSILKKRVILILALWLSVYLAFQSVHVVFPRYVLPALPIIYIFFVYMLRTETLVQKSIQRLFRK